MFARGKVIPWLALWLVVSLDTVWGQEIVKVESIPYYGESSPDDYARERCKLDVWYPKGARNYPTVVWLHGGGLQSGDRHSGEQVAQRLTADGIAVVLVDYRLSPQARCPAYIEDAAAAVAWTIKNIARYEGDPARVFVSGHSAGGYLTAMVGLDQSFLARHDISTRQLAGLLPVSGQMITHTAIREERGISTHTPIIDSLAPAYHAAKQTPRCLCIVGDNDLPARLEENTYATAAFKATGNESFSCMIFRQRDHTTIVSEIGRSDDVVARAMLAFVKGE